MSFSHTMTKTHKTLEMTLLMILLMSWSPIQGQGIVHMRLPDNITHTTRNLPFSNGRNRW